MNESNTDILKRAFPNIFQSLYSFYCGDGWFDPIAKIANFISNKTAYCKAVEVKEKFGTLRFYVEFTTDMNGETLITQELWDEIENYITSIEEQTKNICEDCGADLNKVERTQQKKIGYWVRNLCVPCGEQYISRVRHFNHSE